MKRNVSFFRQNDKSGCMALSSDNVYKIIAVNEREDLQKINQKLFTETKSFVC